MGFRLVPKSVTLNDLEQRNGPYFAFFAEFGVAFGVYYVKVVQVHQLRSTDALCSSR